MKSEEYRELSNRLSEYDDIRKVKEETGLDEDLLLVIYTQRFSRDVTRNFYKVKAYTKRLCDDWNAKHSFCALARKWHFSPVMIAFFIMLAQGCTRKQFWKYVRDPDCAPDKRLKREFREIADCDMVYSPLGTEIQYARGRWGEAMLGEWLEHKGLGHRTEKDLRGTHTKTPDCLLDKPYDYNGIKINWIESKATFGDEFEFRKNARKQLKPYVDLFGKGIVVYWFGFVDTLEPPEGVFIVDGRFFEFPREGGKKPRRPKDFIKPIGAGIEAVEATVKKDVRAAEIDLEAAGQSAGELPSPMRTTPTVHGPAHALAQSSAHPQSTGHTHPHSPPQHAGPQRPQQHDDSRGGGRRRRRGGRGRGFGGPQGTGAPGQGQMHERTRQDTPAQQLHAQSAHRDGRGEGNRHFHPRGDDRRRDGRARRDESGSRDERRDRRDGERRPRSGPVRKKAEPRDDRDGTAGYTGRIIGPGDE